MPHEQIATLKCQDCHIVLDESPSAPADQRPPCPVCGSTRRLIERTLQGAQSVHSQLSIKGRRGGHGEPFVEQKIGDDLHRKTGRWKKLNQRVDRENDWYDKEVVDRETGQCIRDVHEPLSKHQGYGSAKNQGATHLRHSD